MKVNRCLLLTLVLALAVPVLAQQKRMAPRILAFSVQGTSVNLDLFKGKQKVVLVFYRTAG